MPPPPLHTVMQQRDAGTAPRTAAGRFVLPQLPVGQALRGQSPTRSPLLCKKIGYACIIPPTAPVGKHFFAIGRRFWGQMAQFLSEWLAAAWAAAVPAVAPAATVVSLLTQSMASSTHSAVSASASLATSSA